MDPDDNSLSAREAIFKMLENDRRWDSDKDTPVFRDEQGKEITYTESSKELKEALKRANLQELATGTHSPRICGSTAYTNLPSGGELVAGFMGLWLSNPKYNYMHAAQYRLELVGTSITREDGAGLGVRPGLVSRYAGKW